MIEMVLIPEGIFMMGSPENEEGSINSERPQHEVTIKSFLMGKYSVTQKNLTDCLLKHSGNMLVVPELLRRFILVRQSPQT
ncbi:MAG: formylglycine-generating enzyme family protein [Dolichospermum sp.]